MNSEMSFFAPLSKKAVVSVPSVQANPGRAGYYRPWRFIPAEKSGTSRIMEYGPKTKGLKIHLEIRQFPPDGINCSAGPDGIIVTGKHAEKKDKIGKVSREFTRVYYIPDDIDEHSLTWKISKAGILKINLSKIMKEDKKKSLRKPSQRKEVLQENKAEDVNPVDDSKTEEPKAA